MPERVETLVVGGGISGLAYAQARGPGADLLVLEAEPRAGGLIRTARGGRAGELRYECGPEVIRASNQAVRELCDELGLALEPAHAALARRWLVHRGRLVPVPLSPPALLASPLLSPRGKLALLCEPVRARRRALDGSLADFVRHRLGAEVLERMVEPAVAGIHAGDPEQLSARAAFPRLIEMVERHGSLLAGLWAARHEPRGGLLRPRGGIEELARALATALGARLATGTRARSLERGAGGWRVDSDAGPLEADRVVLALPAREAGRLLERAAPECSAELAGRGAESLVSVVHVWRRESVRHALDGFGYLAPAAAGGAVLGTLFSSSIDPAAAPAELVLLRTLLGGARAPNACRLADGELLSESLESARPLLGLEGQPEWSDVRRWPEVLPRYDLGHPARLARIERATPPGLALLGNFAGGIGVSALVEHARGLAASHGSPSRSSADRAGSAGAAR